MIFIKSTTDNFYQNRLVSVLCLRRALFLFWRDFSMSWVEQLLCGYQKKIFYPEYIVGLYVGCLYPTFDCSSLLRNKCKT